MSNQGGWNLEYDGVAPPLPEEESVHISVKKSLPEGAYLFLFDPVMVREWEVELPKVLVGLLRIHGSRAETEDKVLITGSADIYTCTAEDLAKHSVEEPSDADNNSSDPTEVTKSARAHRLVRALSTELDGMDEDADRLTRLQFSRRNYRYYCRLADLVPSTEDGDATGSKRLILGFDTHSFNEQELAWRPGQRITVEIGEGGVGKIGDSEFKANRVSNSLNTKVGEVYVVWVSEKLRHAIVNVHTIEGLEAPFEKERWDKVLAKVGWSVELKDPICTIQEDPQKDWTIPELIRYHDQHPKSEQEDLSAETERWEYLLMVVGRVENTRLGQMFDFGDSPEEQPRQVAAIAARAQVEERRAGELQSCKELFNWTALHELGHMQGLYHSPAEEGLMKRRDDQSGAVPEGSFFHSEKDAMRLRHLPDQWVRPGGVPFGLRYQVTPVNVLDLLPPTDGLRLRVEPMRVLPGRQPTEFVLTLENLLDRNILRPHSDELNPKKNRLGLIVRMPAGGDKVICQVLPPRDLRPMEAVPLFAGEKTILQVPWSRPFEFRQAGIYQLELHLCWVQAHRSGGQSRIYRVSATGLLEV